MEGIMPISPRQAPSGRRKANRETGERGQVLLTPEFLKDFAKSTYTPSFNKVNLELWQTKHRRTGGFLPKVVRTSAPGVADLLSDRSMETPSDAVDLHDDIIEKVARANSVGHDCLHILPEVRASPCQIHSKASRRSDPFYVPSQQSRHFRHKNTELARQVVPNNSFMIDRDQSLVAKKSNLDRKSLRTGLPAYMPSKEFVMTWLMYGSDPQGKNHFPDLVRSNGAPKSNKSKKLHKDPLIDE